MFRLLRYARRYAARTAWGCAMLLLTQAAAMAIPQLFRFAVDGLEDGRSFENLQSIAMTLLLLAAAGAVFRVLSRVHLFYAARDVEMDLRNDFYIHLTRQAPSFFAERPMGDLMSRATNDLHQVRLLLGPGILNIFNTVVAYAAAIPLMYAISPKLTWLSMAIYPPSLILVGRLSRRLYQRTRAQQEQMGGLSAFVQENLAGSHVVRAFGLEKQQRRRFEEQNNAYYAANVRLDLVRSYVWRIMVALASVGVLLALWVGGADVIAGRLTLGELVALTEYLAILSWPSFAIGWVLSLWQRGASSMDRLGQIFSVEPEILPGPRVPTRMAPEISARGLTIDLDGRRVLDDVSFDVPVGATLGIVGPIGAGKSTLVRAMVRALRVSPGQLSVAGEDVTELDLDTLRSAFGFVHQTPLLFSKTVADNVAFGRPTASREEIETALVNAAFEQDLAILPHGLDTPVGERGITLSGGQKQRTAIARALLLDPAVLILDDALSAVDSQTEAQILSRLRSLREGRTTVIVAHRITAVQHADEILVLDRGRVAERGRHDDLLGRDGIYARLARRQQLEDSLAAGKGDRRSA